MMWAQLGVSEDSETFTQKQMDSGMPNDFQACRNAAGLDAGGQMLMECQEHSMSVRILSGRTEHTDGTPCVFSLSGRMALLFADMLYDDFVRLEPSQWTDYEEAFQTFLYIAPTSRLEAFRADSVHAWEVERTNEELLRRTNVARRARVKVSNEPGDSGELFGDGCS